MRYIVIGAGGIGGAIGAYLAADGKDTAFIARGEHLRAIQNNGFTSHTTRRGDLYIKDMKAYAAEDNFEKADVILVCVKGYSLMETIPVIAKSAHEKTVVIPILNTLDAGGRLGAALPKLCVLNGCMYGSSFISAPGVITQPSQLFKIVFGARQGFPADQNLLGQIASDLDECGVDAVISKNIELDVFKKFVFISAFAATDSFFDVTLGELQKPGEERDMFIGLLKELKSIADAKKLVTDTDIIEDSIKMLDAFDPKVTSSMHKDILAGRNFEKQELIFDVVELAKSLKLEVPGYVKAAGHFGYGQ